MYLPIVTRTVILSIGAALLFTACADRKRFFSLQDNGAIGISFENRLTYTEDLNAYLFRGFYNGSGSALADFNNDGNADLFFCGNQVSNRLYLGNGKFQFRDITAAAGVESTGSWTTGVSIADVNQDGWRDIYLCKSGPLNTPHRKNQLFINQGVNDSGIVTFKDVAAEYGIDDLAFSIQSVFFDYDRDGDLDMYLSANSQHRSDMVITAKLGARTQSGGGSKLYENTGHNFVDVTRQAGIYDSPIGFGLGISVSDINKDGWPDLYVANDFFEKDYLYINQRDGTFNESIDVLADELSQGSMGVDMSDINHDGYPEIFVTEMLPEREDRLKTKVIFDSWYQYTNRLQNGYHRQFPRNTLQLNSGPVGRDSSVYFQEISRYAGVAATDWSWGVQMADFDNDGQKEIFVTNGIGKDLLDRDFLSYYDNPQALREILKSKGRVMSELFDIMPSEPLPNYLFKLDSDLVFHNVAAEFGIDQPAFSSGSAYGDIDNDGDLDLVVNNINSPPFIYRNDVPRNGNHFLSVKLQNEAGHSSVGAQLSVWAGGKLFYEELFPIRGAMSAVDDRLLVGLGRIGKIDSIEVRWPSGNVQKVGAVPVDKFTVIEEQPGSVQAVPLQGDLSQSLLEKIPAAAAGIDFTHRESRFVDFDRDNLLFQMFSNEGPKLAVGDIDKNGLQDFFVGGAKGQGGAIYRQTDHSFEKQELVAPGDAPEMEQQHALFFDADNDGDEDLAVASGSSEFAGGSMGLANRLYFNDGKGNFDAVPRILPTTSGGSSSVITAADFDLDGDLDLFIGGRLLQAAYGVRASSAILQNNGKGEFTNLTATMAPGLQHVGLVTDAVWSDIDTDGDPDLVIAGEWMPLKVFVNEKGQFSEAVSNSLAGSSGLWNVIVKADLDADGDDDFVVGNNGRNTFLKAGIEQPVRMHIGDFDGNGTVEQILSVYHEGKSYPLAPKDVLTRQLPFLQKKYLKFSSYKGQTVSDIFSDADVSGVQVSEISETASAVLWNDKGVLNLEALPYQAQLSSVYAICCEDLNGDGLKDIVLGGNQYNAQPQVGISAGFGQVLINRGNRSFEALSCQKSGFFIRGQVRCIRKIAFRNRDLLLVARNNDSLEMFEICTAQ